MRSVVMIVAGYLLGTIPFGYLIVRAKAGVDVRQTGSGGTGATNVLRRAGKVAGALTLVLDALKGAGAVWLSRRLVGHDQTIGWLVAVAAIAVIIGHIFPLWLGFRGGKGVATGVGVFLCLAPIPLALAAVVFVLVVAATSYVSAGSIISAAAMPFFVWLQNVFIKPVPGSAPVTFVAVGGAVLIIFAHRTNIGRLLQGTENKFM
jgi:acyl phosphate:glycerol-3-phosphate acyltransferase